MTKKERLNLIQDGKKKCVVQKIPGSWTPWRINPIINEQKNSEEKPKPFTPVGSDFKPDPE